MITRIPSVLLVLFINLSYLLCNVDDVPVPNTCQFGAGKPPGDFNFNHGIIKAENPSVAVHRTANARTCKYLCTLDKNCWYIEIREKESKCYFYDKKSKVAYGYHTVFWWIPCEIPQSCKQLPHRCKGFWLLRNGFYVSGLQVIKTLTNIHDTAKCRSECLSIPICESINYRYTRRLSHRTRYCDLLQFPSFNRTYIMDNTSMLYEWHCCPHNDDDLPQVCRDQKGKCRGMWKPKPNETLSVNGSIAQVFTMSKFDCMSMCDKNPYCWSVYFNQTNAKCVLRGKNVHFVSNCVGFNPNTGNASDWFVYEWTCCDPEQNPIQPHPKDPDPFDARCVCLNGTSVGDSLLAKDGCTKPLTAHSVTINSPLAAFWLRENKEVTMNGKAWTRIFNGEIYLWVSRSISQLEPCPKHHCDIYSTVIDPHAKCPPIVRRSEWYGRPPKWIVTNFKSTPHAEIVLDTTCPELGCHSLLSCSDYMRQFQYRHQVDHGWNDIAFNFVVGEDGRVYEGRGADVVGSHTLGWNMASEGIALIGWFKYRVPSIASLRAMRLHMRCMASRSEVTKTYKVFAHRDVRPSKIPGQLLYELLPNWQHYYRTMLPSGPDCDSVYAAERRKFIIIVSAGVFSGCILVVICLVYNFVWRHAWWCPVRRFGMRVFSRHGKSTILCSVGQRNAFERHVRAWPTNSTFKRAATLQIHPLRTNLFVLMEKNRQECACLTFISLLWARCVRHSIFEFPALLNDALAMRHCKSYRILLWCDSLYLLHVQRRATARSALQSLRSNACMCRHSTFDMYPISTPNLDSLHEFKADRNPFDACYIRENERHRINLKEYCCVLEKYAGIERDVTYEEFQRREEEGAAVDIEDRMSDSSTSDSEAELIHFS